MQSYKAKISRVIFEKKDADKTFYILAVYENLVEYTVKGNSSSSLKADMEIEFTGTMDEYNGKPQVKANFIKASVAPTVRGAKGWLMTKPVKGVGKKTAEKLIRAFPTDLHEILRSPEKIATVGIPKQKAKEIADAWMCLNIPNDILELFGTKGLSPSVIVKIINRYGSDLKKVIQEDPWKMALEVSGVGFKTADNIAIDQGLDMNHPSRYQAAIRHCIGYELRNMGHSGITENDLINMMSKIGIKDKERTKSAIEVALGFGQVLVKDELSGLLFDPAMFYAERKIASRIAQMMSIPPKLEADQALALIKSAEEKRGIVLDESQRQAALMALTSSVSVITGGPGTGKSTTQAVILEALSGLDDEIVMLIAPTGRAAKRLSEATGGDASTIHRGLVFMPEDMSFYHDEYRPLKASTIVIDEFSMVDSELGSSLMKAVANGSRVIIVGDDQQLPSVGQGQVLADLINSNAIPVSKLSVIHRQAEKSGIIKAAHALKDGRSPEINDRDVLLSVCESEDSIQKELIRLLSKTLPSMGYNPSEDVMVLTPMRKNELGSENLNKIIKNVINPHKDGNKEHSIMIGGMWWSVGDRVMHVRNDYDKVVFNGTIGKVIAIKSEDEDEKAIIVDYGDNKAQYDSSDIRDLTHCWASTVHKVQGSETKVAIIVASPTHSFMLDRNLVYTAATRPKEICWFVGEQRSLASAAKKSDANKRKTGLQHHMRHNMGLPPLERSKTYDVVPQASVKPKIPSFPKKLSYGVQKKTTVEESVSPGPKM